MFGLSTWELVAILAVALLLFGANRLPDIGRGLGQAIRGFKKSLSEPELPPKGEPPPERRAEEPPQA